MPSTATRSSPITRRGTRTRASTGACTSWSGRSRSTRRSSATESIPRTRLLKTFTRVNSPSHTEGQGMGQAGPAGRHDRRVLIQMKLREFIVTEAITPELQASDRDGVIRELVTALACAGALPTSAVDEVVAAVVKREQNGSTGFGKGVAVPHVKHPK